MLTVILVTTAKRIPKILTTRNAFLLHQLTKLKTALLTSKDHVLNLLIAVILEHTVTLIVPLDNVNNQLSEVHYAKIHQDFRILFFFQSLSLLPNLLRFQSLSLLPNLLWFQSLSLLPNLLWFKSLSLLPKSLSPNLWRFQSLSLLPSLLWFQSLSLSRNQYPRLLMGTGNPQSNGSRIFLIIFLNYHIYIMFTSSGNGGK